MARNPNERARRIYEREQEIIRDLSAHRLPDEHCPECHGAPEIQHTFRGGVRRRCTDCGHTWREETKTVTREKWIRREES